MIGGLVVIVVLAWLNIRGIGESAKLNFFLAIADLLTQVLIIIFGAFLVLNPSVLVNQVNLGTVPTYSHLIFALVAGHARLYRDRDGLEHGRGGA